MYFLHCVSAEDDHGVTKKSNFITKENESNQSKQIYEEKSDVKVTQQVHARTVTLVVRYKVRKYPVPIIHFPVKHPSPEITRNCYG